MKGIGRRGLLAAGATLPAAAMLRKPAAAQERLLGMEALRRSDPPAALPEFAWTLADGTPQRVADHAGHGLVINLWATWCQPCVAEMPALDRLTRALEGSGVRVLPLSSDRAGAPQVERFYRDRGLQTLPVLLDPRGAASRALGARGIPTTIIVDRDGRERARLEGGADWGSKEAQARVLDLVGQGGKRDDPTVAL